MEEEGIKKKKNIKNYLDNVFSDDGIKTDIKITVTNQTLQRVSLYSIGTVFVSTLIVFGIRGIIKNMEH